MVMNWVKSSYSSGTGEQCVEVAACPDGSRAVRDSKDPGGSHLAFGRDAREAFTTQVKAEASES